MCTITPDYKFLGTWATLISSLPRSYTSLILHKPDSVVQKTVLLSETEFEAFHKVTAHISSREVKNARYIGYKYLVGVLLLNE